MSSQQVKSLSQNTKAQQRREKEKKERGTLGWICLNAYSFTALHVRVAKAAQPKLRNEGKIVVIKDWFVVVKR